MKRWEISILYGPPARHEKEIITLGNKSDKNDVKQAIKRQGIGEGGEILGITDLDGDYDAGTQDGGGSMMVLVIMAGVLIAIYLLFRKPKTAASTKTLTPDQVAFLLNTGQMSLDEANRLIGGV